MGCDIHFYVEKRQPGCAWELVDKLVDKGEEYGYTDGPHWAVEDYKEQYYNGRDYFLFGILAQVRGQHTPDFGPARGRPDDESDGYKLVADQDGCDGHSHSYLSLEELLDYPWMSTFATENIVPFEAYAEWVRSGDQAHRFEPGGERKWWAKELIETDAMEELVATYNGLLEGGTDLQKATADVFVREHMDKYAKASYDSTLAARFPEFMKTLHRLQTLAKDVGHDNVRVVFHFDN